VAHATSTSGADDATVAQCQQHRALWFGSISNPDQLSTANHSVQVASSTIEPPVVVGQHLDSELSMKQQVAVKWLRFASTTYAICDRYADA